MSTNQATKNPRTRSDVRRDYGHPWPWMSPELFREHVLERDDLRKEIAADMATDPWTLRRWEVRHGFAEHEHEHEEEAAE